MTAQIIAGAFAALVILIALGAFWLNKEEHEDTENEWEGRNG